MTENKKLKVKSAYHKTEGECFFKNSSKTDISGRSAKRKNDTLDQSLSTDREATKHGSKKQRAAF